ncbi:hypothetical protein Bbelb_118350 [Branchiostoma belcheri]|nr:hypothetical protein Bbelb_118350 [Branchiostoma belcheri]
MEMLDYPAKGALLSLCEVTGLCLLTVRVMPSVTPALSVVLSNGVMFIPIVSHIIKQTVGLCRQKKSRKCGRVFLVVLWVVGGLTCGGLVGVWSYFRKQKYVVETVVSLFLLSAAWAPKLQQYQAEGCRPATSSQPDHTQNSRWKAGILNNFFKLVLVLVVPDVMRYAGVLDVCSDWVWTCAEVYALFTIHHPATVSFVLNVTAGFVGYILAWMACALRMGYFGFALPAFLSTLVTAIVIFIKQICTRLSFFHEETCVDDYTVWDTGTCLGLLLVQFFSTTWFVMRSPTIVMEQEAQVARPAPAGATSPTGTRAIGTEDLDKAFFTDLCGGGINFRARDASFDAERFCRGESAKRTLRGKTRVASPNSNAAAAAQVCEEEPVGIPLDPARDLTAARPNCKSRSAPYHTPYGSRRETDRVPDGSLTETGRQGDQKFMNINYKTPQRRPEHNQAPTGSRKRTFNCDPDSRRTLGVMTPTGVYAEDMPNGRRFKCDLSIRLFWLPGYNSVFPAQWMLLSRKNRNTKGEDFTTRRKTKQNTHVYICTTMYHESEREMEQLLTSLRVLAESQVGERTFESHIFFDGGCRQRQPSQWALQLFSVMERTLQNENDTEGILQQCTRYRTPYGLQLQWDLQYGSGDTASGMELTVHLKDNVLVKNKKRWSQVMYMSYTLDYAAYFHPLGMSSGVIADTDIKATSRYGNDPSHGGHQARLNAVGTGSGTCGWTAGDSDIHQGRHSLTVTLLGGGEYPTYEVLHLAFSLPAWPNQAKSTCGKRLIASDNGEGQNVQLRTGKYGSSLVTVLHRPGQWCTAGHNPAKAKVPITPVPVGDVAPAGPGRRLQIYLGEDMVVTGVVTQGKHGCEEWVTGYHLSYSQDGETWEYYNDEYGWRVTLEGNDDSDTPKRHILDRPIKAAYISFNPVSWNNRISMRVELLGYCATDLDRDSYILATDADIKFSPQDAQALMEIMCTDPDVGAVCARTHPLGEGPLVWYQVFDYAIGHWFQKVANSVLGTVLCCPGCFSVYRCKAVRDTLATYASTVSKGEEFLTKDMGEDRWLCTLMVEKGWRLEYTAVSEDSTYCPEEFDEFFNQRRRWIPSTIANQLELIRKWGGGQIKSDYVSKFFIMYQGFLLFSSMIGPSTVILIMAAGLELVVGSAGGGIVPTVVVFSLIFIGFGVLCVYAKQDTQLKAREMVTAFQRLDARLTQQNANHITYAGKGCNDDCRGTVCDCLTFICKPLNWSKNNVSTWNGMSTGISLTHIYAYIPGTIGKTSLSQMALLSLSHFDEQTLCGEFTTQNGVSATERNCKLIFREFLKIKDENVVVTSTPPMTPLEQLPLPVSVIYFLSLAALYVLTALLHPSELLKLLYGFVYLLSLPSGYILLTIYSVCNMTDRSWGTREIKVPGVAVGGKSVTEMISNLCRTLCRREDNNQPPLEEISIDDPGEETENDESGSESGSSGSDIQSLSGDEEPVPFWGGSRRDSARWRRPSRLPRINQRRVSTLSQVDVNDFVPSQWPAELREKYEKTFKEHGFVNTSFIFGMTTKNPGVLELVMGGLGGNVTVQRKVEPRMTLTRVGRKGQRRDNMTGRERMMMRWENRLG